MIVASNILTFIRGPLAFLFLFHSPMIRLGTLIAALISDLFDGYMARKWSATSRFGAFLDPVMDKFFVIFVLTVFVSEGTLSVGHLALMLSRDFSLLIFLGYLIARRKTKEHKFQPVISGKISTGLQFITLILVTLKAPLPSIYYYLFPLFGLLVLLEMFYHEFYPVPSKGNE
jgi:CDP-diacylglycerol--glycerol-3-phosphate 3-phosphatidyltransferase